MAADRNVPVVISKSYFRIPVGNNLKIISAIEVVIVIGSYK